MQSDLRSPPAAAAPPDDPPRVKFLCSFGGSILPRPLDGRLRYVGGETRIVSVPRDVSFGDLVSRMRDLFDAAAAIKYQHPDEDLDALVSVVNDDDVANMMEEYDKLGASGDGFVRIRIFLFPLQQSELDATAAGVGQVHLEAEQRYVDALNSLADSKIQPSSYDATNIEMLDMAMYPQLHYLNIPQRSIHGDVNASSSPTYYPLSPGQNIHGHQAPDQCIRPPPEYHTYQNGHQSPAFVENMACIPPEPVLVQQQSGYSGNHGGDAVDGSRICENCHTMFHQAQSSLLDSRYPCPFAQQLYTEEANVGNGCNFPQCHRPESYILNPNHGVYKDPHAVHQHQLSIPFDDLRIHAFEASRPEEHHPVDGSAINNTAYPQGHVYGGDAMPLNSNGPEGIYYLQNATETGNGALHAQQMVGGTPCIHTPVIEDTGTQYVNYSPQHAPECFYPLHRNLPPVQPMWRSPHTSPHAETLYETDLATTNVTSPLYAGSRVDEQTPNTWVIPNGTVAPRIMQNDWSSLHNICKVCSDVTSKEIQLPVITSTQCQPGIHHAELNGDVLSIQPPCSFVDSDGMIGSSRDQHSPTMDAEEVAECKTSSHITNSIASPTKKVITEFGTEGLKHADGNTDAALTTEHMNISAQSLSFLPDLIASLKKAVLEGVEEVKARAEANPDAEIAPATENEPSSQDVGDTIVDRDLNAENTPKIEPTIAEAEALAKGLQTIKYADLEEIQQLGLGAYGAVYHGKWRGCDVAIKRIKASCFAGKPSERERLIADFWKEALILSSLHHPNIVSFYGVVRDGPSGSLATVTEFMVNGSLKQFLQKKDRTIDRRKRLILAMDTAFGMEYLHEKNIVHFDLKCENLLVNMRDPHRPICKIGDLGLSKVKQHTFVSGGVRGTLPYMAPELLSGKSNMVTEKIDVYSFGIVMWELLTGEEPYADMRCAAIIGGIVNNTLHPQVPIWCDPEWKSLMESCWDADPLQRPSFSEISERLRKMSAAMNHK